MFVGVIFKQPGRLCPRQKDGQSVIVKVDDDCKLEFNRTAISSVELTDAEKAKIAEEAKSKKLFKGKKSSETAEVKAAETTEENK